MIKFTEPTVNLGSSRPVWINPENIAYFFEWTYRQFPTAAPGQRSEATIIATTCIIFNASAAEDAVSVNVLERPEEVASLINGEVAS